MRSFSDFIEVFVFIIKIKGVIVVLDELVSFVLDELFLFVSPVELGKGRLFPVRRLLICMLYFILLI